MKLIDANAVVTVRIHDAMLDDYVTEKVTIEKYLDCCTDERCPEAVEAIPVEWIEEYIKGFKKFAYGNGMSDMVAFQMRDIIEKWREEQK